MTKTRFTPWVVLACIGALAGCTSGEGGTAGNTELNVVVPNNTGQSSAPGAIDIQVVEYTISCADGADSGPFLDNGATLDDDVTINGVLEVLDTASGGVSIQDFGPDLDEVYVWQGFMDLPPTAGCTVQLRARDGDGEVICTATEVFDIAADSTTKVNVLMYCGISFQAPVGMLDLDGDFSFNVANFCPDLFVLNCIDSELDVQVTPFGDFLATACQVRFRDADSSCGGSGIAPADPDGASSCDPQDCVTTPEGLDCAPRPGFVDPEVVTTVVCSSTLGACAISCDGATPAASCSFAGDTLGTIGDPAPGPLAPGEGGFFVTCATTVDPVTGDTVPLTPGDNITCTATTTDGDTDCNKVKVVDLTVSGLSACQDFTAGGGSCADGNDCTDDVCNDATCDGTAANCCTNPNSPAGTTCVAPGGGLCDGAGVCVAQGCTSDAQCEIDGNVCTVPAAGTCVGGACTLPEVPGNAGGACDSGTGSGIGTCGPLGGPTEGTCVSSDLCDTGADCGDGNVCTQDVCSGAPLVCSNPNEAAGTACSPPAGGACDGAGVCAAPPVIDAGGPLATSTQALPTTATGCTYDSVNTICTGCTITGPSVPGGGQCGAFGPQIVGGCEVPGGVLNAQLAIDVTITTDIESDGANNITHDVTVFATNPALSTAAGLVSVDAASLFTTQTGANPAQLQNDLNPAMAGDVLGAFTAGTNDLILNNNPADGNVAKGGIEIPTVVTAVTPTVPSGGSVSWNYDTFSLLLTIISSGTPLLVDDAGCIFDLPGGDVTLGVN